MNDKRTIKAPTGTKLQAKSWLTEAPLRMLMNNLDPEVAERPEDLVVYGGIGKAARNWDAFDRIIETLKELEADETLLVQSGKPVGVFRTHEDAPRVLIANSNLVPAWANWEHFRELDRKGLMMFGQMTAGSWIYIGSQGIVQGTYETFVEMGRQQYGGDLSGRWILTAGLGGMGGAQPLAATMAGASMLAIECEPSRIQKRLDTGYLDTSAESLDEAMALIDKSIADKQPLSVGLLGNAAEILPEMLRRGIRPDAVTDQTSAHDPANGYLPIGWTLEQWEEGRENNPDAVADAARKSMVPHVEAMLEFHAAGIPTFDYGNNIRQEAHNEGLENAFDFPGFVPAYVRPLFCRGIGPFRWAALSGDPEDIYRTDAKVKELIPDNPHLHAWLDAAKERIQFQGLPSRICWVGLGERDRLGLAFNEMVRNGELSAPVVIGRDHMLVPALLVACMSASGCTVALSAAAAGGMDTAANASAEGRGEVLVGVGGGSNGDVLYYTSLALGGGFYVNDIGYFLINNELGLGLDWSDVRATFGATYTARVSSGVCSLRAPSSRTIPIATR